MRVALSVKPPTDEERSDDISSEMNALLVRVAESRDHDAFKSLFSHFGPRIKSLIMRSGASAAQSEDLVQEVMMTVWRKAHLFSADRGSASAWIFTIARNARIDRLRRGSARAFEDVEDMNLISENADSEEEVDAAQRARLVGSAIANLPDEQRQIIELAFLHDKSQSEICHDLSLPLGTVKSRMRLAYGKLRAQLEELK